MWDAQSDPRTSDAGTPEQSHSTPTQTSLLIGPPTATTNKAPRFASEDELLLSCCRTHVPSGAVVRAAECLSQSLDWEYLLQASIVHGVSPIFFHGLDQVLRATSAQVPSSSLECLTRLVSASRERNRKI